MNLKYRSVLALGMSAAMMMQAPVVAFAGGPAQNDVQTLPQAEAVKQQDQSQATEQNSVPQEGHTDSIGYNVGYNGFNVYGINGDKTIQTTCGDGGYTTNIKVGDNTDTLSPRRTGDNVKFFYGEEYQNQNNGITTVINAEAKGNAVIIDYSMKNDSGSDQTVKIGSNADTKIGDIDSAPVQFIENGAAIQMSDGKGENATKFVVAPVGEEFSTAWYGSYGDRTKNQFEKLTPEQMKESSDYNENGVYTKDSGIAWSWEVTVPSGQTVTRTAILAAGQLTIYNVSYDANGGTGEMKPDIIIDGANNTIHLKNNAFTRDGYSFDGWCLNADGTGLVKKEGDEYVVTAENQKQFYALWKMLAPDVPVPQEIIDEFPAEEPTTEEPTTEEPITEGINIITTATGEALPTAELGNAVAVTKSVSLELSKVTPEQYVEVIRNTVQSVPMQGVAVIETNEVATFDRHIIEAMAERPDVSYTIVFKDAGVKKRVVIPAGFDVLSLLDENGYCGFLRLAAMLGFTIIE